MRFNLIICTYKRSEAIKSLLDSVQNQTLYPDEILIIDASPDNHTEAVISGSNNRNLKYFKVKEQDKGLTRQRNIGIEYTSKEIDIVCFLDDDIILFENYFEKLIGSYTLFPESIGVGGYIENEVEWYKKSSQPKEDEFEIDGWIRKLGTRNLLRKKIGLLSDQPPGVMPEFSNGLSVSFFPPTGGIYPVEFFMGGVSSFRRELFYDFRFSNYFEGYGLYEDMEFCLRISRKGQLYLNTGARVIHNHDSSGRPNRFSYGEMVIRNGWYVWRTKYPFPSLITKFKWYIISLVLIMIRMTNIINTQDRKAALTESIGRFYGLITLFFNKPKNAK